MPTTTRNAAREIDGPPSGATSKPSSPSSQKTTNASTSKPKSATRKSAAKKTTSKSSSSSSKKSDLTLYKVRHEGYDTAGRSIVLAKDPQEARQLISDVLDAQGHAFDVRSHTEVTKANPVDVPGAVTLSKAGVVFFDDGRVT